MTDELGSRSELERQMATKRFGEECRHPYCHGEPYGRVSTPYGEGVFCEEHTYIITAPEMDGFRNSPWWLIDAFRYGPGSDPEPVR